MKIIKLNAVSAALVGAVALLMAVPATSFSEVGRGWDTFNVGDGETIASMPDKAYMGTSLGSAVGQGWDVANVGDGQRIPTPDRAYSGSPPGTQFDQNFGDAYGSGSQ